MGTHSKTRLMKVHPKLADKITAVIADLAMAGRDVRVVSGLRTYAEQNALYAQGRTKPGAKVTNAKAGQSNHNFGMAVDLCPFKGGSPDWNDTKGFNAIGVAGKKQGLDWGGDWKFVDKPHLELKHGLTLAQCRELYAQGGLPAVWKRVNQKLSASSTGSTNPPAAQDPIEQPQQPTGMPIYHNVKAGDTLSALAKKYGQSVDAIKCLNGLKTDVIRIGDTLRVK